MGVKVEGGIQVAPEQRAHLANGASPVVEPRPLSFGGAEYRREKRQLHQQFLLLTRLELVMFHGPHVVCRLTAPLSCHLFVLTVTSSLCSHCRCSYLFVHCRCSLPMPMPKALYSDARKDLRIVASTIVYHTSFSFTEQKNYGIERRMKMKRSMKRGRKCCTEAPCARTCLRRP